MNWNCFACQIPNYYVTCLCLLSVMSWGKWQSHFVRIHQGNMVNKTCKVAKKTYLEQFFLFRYKSIASFSQEKICLNLFSFARKFPCMIELDFFLFLRAKKGKNICLPVYQSTDMLLKFTSAGKQLFKETDRWTPLIGFSRALVFLRTDKHPHWH